MFTVKLWFSASSLQRLEMQAIAYFFFFFFPVMLFYLANSLWLLAELLGERLGALCPQEAFHKVSKHNL